MQPQLLIDITRLLNSIRQNKHPTGIERVALEYVRHYAKNAKHARALVRVKSRWIIFNSAQSQFIFNSVLNYQLPKEVFDWRLLITAIVKNIFKFSNENLNGWILINVGHTGLESKNYTNNARKLELKQCYFLHDLIPLRYPEYTVADAKSCHLARVKAMLHHADIMIVNSTHTYTELEKFTVAHNYTMPHSLIAPLAPAQLAKTASVIDNNQTIALAQPYFVMLGTVEPRKNHLLILQIWRELVTTYGNKAPHLVIVGRMGWKSDNVTQMLQRCPSLQAHVKHLPNSDDAELQQLMLNSTALLFPSFAEGYGMPLVEALNMGVPVIASNLPVFVEVAGDVPDYKHPLDATGWMQLITEYAYYPHLSRQAQLKRMSMFKATTWEDHFDKVDSALSILGHSHFKLP